MSNKEYPEYIATSLKSYDKNIIVEELLEKLKAQGCFDAKRKQFLSEITNKPTYQNLHTKVENLATKFLETVRWPPSVQKHQLREQLRLHIQSTDQFNNCISRLIEQEVNCKIQGELKPLIESKACEYLEVNYDKWKQNMLTQIYENFQTQSSNDSSYKVDIKKEYAYSDSKMDIDNDLETNQSTDSLSSSKNIKLEHVVSQSSMGSSSTCNSSSQSVPKYSGIGSQKSPQTMHSNYVTTPPAMPPPIGLLPPPHRILPNNLFQPLPPPPPPMFLPLERFPPPPPPEDKSLPPPPPPENGPNTPTEEYSPKFHEAIMDISIEKTKSTLTKTPDKSVEKLPEVKIFSPKKIIWGNIVLPIQDVSDDSVSESEKYEHERRRYSRRSPHHQSRRTVHHKKETSTKRYEEPRPKESWRKPQRTNRPQTVSHTRQKSNEYTDVSSESLNEMEFKDNPPVVNNNPLVNKKPLPSRSSSSEDSQSSSSNDQTLDLIRKINKKKTKMRQNRKTPIQSSSSYSSSDSSSESSSTDHSQPEKIATNYRDVQRGYRIFGRSQSGEKDMDISLETQSPLNDPKSTSPKPEINLDSIDSVQMRKNQIKARLEEIDAKRSQLQKQQLLTTATVESISFSSTTSSSSINSSSESTTITTSIVSTSLKSQDDNDNKSMEIITSKLLASPKCSLIDENEQAFNQPIKNESLCNEDCDIQMDQDSEPEEGELSSESRAGSMKRDDNTIPTENITVDIIKAETVKMEYENIANDANAQPK